MRVRDHDAVVSRAVWRRTKLKLRCARQVAQMNIVARRADEDQIIVLHVIEREQAAALDPEVVIEGGEDAVQFVNGEHFALARKVAGIRLPLVARRIIVAHWLLGTAAEPGVAEDRPRGGAALNERRPEMP